MYVRPFLATPTSSSQRIVVEACFANRERSPPVPILAPFTPSTHTHDNSLSWLDPRIRVNDVEVLVHPQLMRVIAHQHRPVLRRIRVFVDLVRDQFPQSGLLCKPLARQPSHGVPADLHWARRTACQGLRDGNNIFRRAEPNRVFEGYIAFLVTFLAARGVRRAACDKEGHESGAVHVQQVVEFIALPFLGRVAAIAIFTHDVFCVRAMPGMRAMLLLIL